MRIVHLLAAGAATIAVAAPAAAQQTYYPAPQQTYPQYQYPQQGYAQYQYPQQTYPQYQYPQQGYPQYQYPQQGYAYPGQQGQNVIGQIINQLLGNRYNVTDRTAVTQCASAAMAQASAQYSPRGYPQGYGQGYGYPGYHQGYNPAANMRVTAITDVRRLRRGLRVSGQMSSGMHGGYGAYGAPGYGNRHYAGAADLNFRCNVAYNGQVTNVRITRNNPYRR